jgi:putative FmdB family regulatory protein
MPIYEYQCESCGAHLEKLQKISDPVLKDCPECKKASLKKMVSATSFRLKGTGWYETDFKTGNKKHGAESKSPDKAVVDKKASAENSGNNSTSSSAKSGKPVKSSTKKEAST